MFLAVGLSNFVFLIVCLINGSFPHTPITEALLAMDAPDDAPCSRVLWFCGVASRDRVDGP
ncbi:hypothetical protein BDQ12DRAFT_686442 [Crucibulum laeve]|uniref:Uncharacterized protein n=1 Tax=Crucibulum laeve TaxID=68775 RepID=A0A5C3LUK1_9AGAR|nr:hypothetical protein BDQ12DRAFT_686442 [Crucibulum laeve]